MRRTRTVALIGLFLAITGVAVQLGAQSPAAPVRQVAFLTASNPQVGAHFGCGGALDGHAGVGVAISSDGNTIAVGAPHESSASNGINGKQNDTSRYDGRFTCTRGEAPAGNNRPTSRPRIRTPAQSSVTRSP